MAGKGLNDEQVAQEMNKMVAFIKQEALEKAREIKVKADEEFNIEKAKLVRQETIAIEAFYQKKTKQAEVQRKISQSNHINKSRLKVLQARKQMLVDLFSTAKTKLPTLTADKAVYSDMLVMLILQGLYQLMENKVLIKCKKHDRELVSNAMVKAAGVYAKEMGLGKEPTLSIDEEAWLDEKSSGGVLLSALEERIKCSNTLESRLELLSEKMLPDIRILLFGPSPNRAFYN
jgi:V-type H+-transporting ATPase subunit E